MEQFGHSSAWLRGNLGTLVVIPTFNEIDNLDSIVTRVRAAAPGVHLLVVDDDSPDGTGQLADAIAEREAGFVHVLHRRTKEGLGAAYLAGFTWGIARNYSVLVEMDADGSHAPEQLSRLLDAVDRGADLVIGSRYIPGGATPDRPRGRRILSRTANVYARALLGTKTQDITAGFRAYRSDVLKGFDLATVTSKGYCFQIDLAWRAIRQGLNVVEVPITFVERQHGSSKMDGATIWEATSRVARWGIRHRLERIRSLGRRHQPEARSEERLAGAQ